MTLVTARQPELFDEIRVVLRQLGVIMIGTVQPSGRHLLYQIDRRRRVPLLAAFLFLPGLDLSFFFLGLLFSLSFGQDRLLQPESRRRP